MGSPRHLSTTNSPSDSGERIVAPNLNPGTVQSLSVNPGRTTDPAITLKPPKRDYPVSKPFTPPPGMADGEVPPSRRAKRILIAAAVLVLLGGAGLALWLVPFLSRSNRISDREAASILDNLRTVQRTWWDIEGFSRTGCEDPEASFARLQEKQQRWFANEGLAAPADKSGAGSLSRLEQMQRDWFEKEGLAAGKPVKDSQVALARLEEINRRWWTGEGLVRATFDEDTGSEESDELAKIKLKLAVDKESTKRYLDTGGTREAEEAVQLGLQWLAAQQNHDGSWSPEGGVRGGARRGGNVTLTALALLPFLARGETHRGSEENHIYTKQVEAGILYLISQQRPDGDLRGGTNMYTHALATMALCECYGMTGDPQLKGPCQRAIDFLIRAQGRDGGWRYTPNPPVSDLSVTSWCLMAIKSGQMAGIIIPRETLERATAFLRHVSRNDGGYGYTKGSPGHSPPQPAVMTAAGIVCRQYLMSSSGQAGGTEDIRSPEMTRGLDIILRNPPGSERGKAKGNQVAHNYYYYYYATYALLPVGGESWRQWNPQVRDLLISLQEKDDPRLRGSWNPQGAYQLQASGRVGVTALALLTLEVYYRNLPLNRPELGEMAKELSKAAQ